MSRKKYAQIMGVFGLLYSLAVQLIAHFPSLHREARSLVGGMEAVCVLTERQTCARVS